MLLLVLAAAVLQDGRWVLLSMTRVFSCAVLFCLCLNSRCYGNGMLDAAAAAALAAVELQDGRWVIFNDEKVAASEHPPLSMGYMYFYRRIGDSTPAQQ
jgi:hypothetical protein